MTADEILRYAHRLVRSDPGNVVDAQKALEPGLTGLRMFEPPLMGVAAADDAYLAGLAEAPQANLQLTLPGKWLPGAKSVISFFFPFTQRVRESNRTGMSYPSDEWLHARIDGQSFINRFLGQMLDLLTEAGYRSVCPSLDARFWSNSSKDKRQQAPGRGEFTSNWSERHVAYACGLGTFSLSKGLITKKGVAGRFSSLITTLELKASARPYTGLFDYCILCGKCAVNCPAGAIDRADGCAGGKKHPPCSRLIDRVMQDRSPYYGCGKCQVAVPCEFGLPPGVAG